MRRLEVLLIRMMRPTPVSNTSLLKNVERILQRKQRLEPRDRAGVRHAPDPRILQVVLNLSLGLYLDRADNIAAGLPVAADILGAGCDQVAEVQVAVQAEPLSGLVQILAIHQQQLAEPIHKTNSHFKKSARWKHLLLGHTPMVMPEVSYGRALNMPSTSQ